MWVRSWVKKTSCQYSFLENPMDRGAWRATVHGVTRVRHTQHIKICMLIACYFEFQIWKSPQKSCGLTSLQTLVLKTQVDSNLFIFKPNDQTNQCCPLIFSRQRTKHLLAWRAAGRESVSASSSCCILFLKGALCSWHICRVVTSCSLLALCLLALQGY